MTDFNSMSPRELKTFASDNEVDLSGIDLRRKREIVRALTSWEKGSYTPPQETADQIVATYSGTAIDDDAGVDTDTETPESVEPGAGFYESDESVADVEHAFETATEGGVTAAPAPSTPTAPSAPGGKDSGRLTATVTEPAPEPVAPPVREPEVPSLESREQLEVADLVGDDNRVRMVLNTFPAVVNGQDMCRLMLVEIPGESDTMALVWFKNSSSGPVQVAPVMRVVSRSTDSETKEQVIITASGSTVTYRRSTGCPTCGNRLSNWRPWRPPVRTVQVAKR